MERYRLNRGRGRTKVSLWANSFGSDLVVFVYNENAHIGAVAVGEYDHVHERASVSLITRLGHKDDAIAQSAAYLISKSSHKPVCVIAGVHLDDITAEEIQKLVENANLLAETFVKSIVLESPEP
jgi:hypothetical protein